MPSQVRTELYRFLDYPVLQARLLPSHRPIRRIDAPRILGEAIAGECERARSGTTAEITEFAFPALPAQVVGMAQHAEDRTPGRNDVGQYSRSRTARVSFSCHSGLIHSGTINSRRGICRSDLLCFRF